MVSFTTGVLTSTAASGVALGYLLWNRSIYGLSAGIIQGVITLGVKHLFGKAASAVYLAGVVIYIVGLIGREAQKVQSKILKTAKNDVLRTIESKIQINQEEIKCPIAKATRAAIQQKHYYNTNNERVNLWSGEELLVQSEFFPNTTDVNATAKFQNTQIGVVNEDCLEAAQKETGQVAVLMFASPLEAGGGMCDGNKAQEEDLCRRTDIFGFMWDQVHFTATSLLYPLVSLKGPHEVDPSYDQMERNGMIHTPRVTVFRAGQAKDYGFLDHPFEVGMLISPAPDRPRLVTKGDDYAREEDREQAKKVITTQLNIAFTQGYDTLILGAFGCGAFRNPPQAVAKLYREIIQTSFKGAFKKIVFAILDDPASKGPHNPMGNFKPFEECFKG